LDRDALVSLVKAKVAGFYNDKALRLGDEVFSHVEKVILLHTLDALWKDHLLSMDHLKGGIGLRGYAQQNPLTEYKKEGFELFAAMIAGLKADSLERVFKVEVKKEDALPPIAEKAKEQKVTLSRGEVSPEPSKQAPVKGAIRVGRNDPCPCGSGQKYKKCCGK
ncbi:MAG: SEC-C metal-binding domain-containing protein, partial [Deltaproteobacteria bacterium]